MLRKKWLSFLVAVSMVAAMLPTTAFAEGDAVQVGSMTTVMETATGENEQQNTEGEKSEGETSEEEKSEGETPAEGEKSDDETSEEEKSEGEKSEGEVSEEEKSDDGKSEGEVSEDEKSEGETNEDETPETPAPETPAANSIMLMNVTGEEGEGEAAVYNVSSADELNKLFNEKTLKDGDTIKLSAGTYEIGARSIPAVSIYGTDGAVIVGSLSYEFEGDTDVKISKVTLRAPEDNTAAKSALNFGNHQAMDGATLTVDNCKIVDYLYGISVNTLAKNCTLKAGNLALDNVWCGVSVKGGDAGNKVGNLTVASGSTVDYETQDWGSKDGKSYNNGYCVTQDAEPVPATEPDLANGEWPAPVTMNGKHYGSLQAAVDALGETGGTIELNADIELDETVWVPAGADVHIVGNGFDIKLPDGDNAAAFSAKPEDGYLEGLRPDTSLIVNGANFVGHDSESVGYAAIVSNGGGVIVGFENCSFTNMFTTMLSQAITDPNAGTSSLTIDASCTFDNVDCLYSVDDGATEGALVDKWDYTMVNPGENAPKPETFAVAVVDGKGYDDLQEAVDALSPAGGTIELKKDVTLTAPVQVPKGMNLTVEGSGHTITLPENAPYSAFNNNTGLEGLKAGTDLAVNNVKFVGDVDKTNSGHAVVIGFEGGVDVNMTNCTFTDMYDAVYCNAVKSKDSESTITISNGMFNNVTHCYGIDNKTEGARVDQHTVSVSFAEGSETPEPESFAAASLNGVAYQSLAGAIANAKPNDIVQLMDDVQLDSMLTINTQGLQLDLNGHTISASNTFPKNSDDNKNHLVDVTANGVTIANGKLKAGSNNNHTLNVWNAQNVTLNGLTLDNTATYDGAPLIVAASDVTLKGSNTFVTGEKSWYGANVDSREIASGVYADASLTMAEGASAVFEGKRPIGIYVENTVNTKNPGVSTKVTVEFEKNTSITSDIPDFVAVVYAPKLDDEGNPTGEVADANIVNPGNAGLVTDANGNFVVKPAPAPQPQQPAGGSSHKHNYTWQHSDDEHWQYCADCGQAISNGPHTLQWKDGYQECTVCGYRVGSSTAAAPAAQASAPAAAAPAAPAALAAAAIPQTGDASNPMLWVVLLAVSGSALGALVYTKKKREE